MISREEYVMQSLELHLFWGRIMKEHLLFLEAGFAGKNTRLIKEAENYKVSFEKFLLEVVKLANGIVRESIIDSGEIFTEYTINEATSTTIASDTLIETAKLIDFKKAATKGILGCEIKSIILPLLSDHVLREANHYLRILEAYEE